MLSKAKAVEKTRRLITSKCSNATQKSTLRRKMLLECKTRLLDLANSTDDIRMRSVKCLAHPRSAIWSFQGGICDTNKSNYGWYDKRTILKLDRRPLVVSKLLQPKCVALTVRDNFSKESHLERKNLYSGCLNKTDLAIKTNELWIGLEGLLVYNAFVRLRQMFKREFWLARGCQIS